MLQHLNQQNPTVARIQLENECTYGRRFQWKTGHLERIKPVKMILKIESTDKNDTDRMTTTYFPPTISQFKEGSGHINESKAPEWMDAKVKTKEIDISNDNRPKMARIGDYWSEEKTTKIIDLLK